ncbi:MAG: CocE/NonD family hydrolase [Chloroflexota bacterium]
MPDGAILLANRYYPRRLGKRPMLLICSVYSNRTAGGAVSQVMAEEGFNVVVVSSRGSFGSTGNYDPFLSERDDAAGVIAWLKQQEWFNGELCTAGASYLGYSQWAIAREAGALLKAMSTQTTGSNFREMIYPGDALYLEVFLFWMHVVESQQKSILATLNVVIGNKRRAKLARHLPLEELDTVLVGHENKFWREWLMHYLSGDNYWMRGNNSEAVSLVAAPNHIVTGWMISSRLSQSVTTTLCARLGTTRI